MAGLLGILGKAKKFGSKYKDELILGGAIGGGSAVLMDQLIYDPLNKDKYYRKHNIEALGEELKDWELRPWDPENDPSYINDTIEKLHMSITDKLDTMLVPRSVASEKATDYVNNFLKMAQNKDGAPSIKGIRNKKVIYEQQTDKDQFGFGTEKKVMQSKPAELLGVKPEDVVRY